MIDLGYTGISINYYATEKESGKEQVFQDMKSRDFSVDVLTTHISPRDEMAESVEIDILRSIAAIYRTKEDFDNSLKFLEKAKSIDPIDINLILLESNIRWEMGEVDMYQDLITKALEIEPNNVDLSMTGPIVPCKRQWILNIFQDTNVAFSTAGPMVACNRHTKQRKSRCETYGRANGCV